MVPVSEAIDARITGPTWRVSLTEMALIFGLFFLFAGCPPPDVNESHYMVKARHYWSPGECGGDIFLDSDDAHTVFYWTFGWMTLWGSLPAVTWIGRVATWGLLAVAWQRLSWAIVPRKYVSLLTAAWYLVLLANCHLAGEWVVGGLEAKSVAYALVFCGMRSIVLGQWRAVWLWFGGAATFHVLVGGWSVVAAAVVWILIGTTRPALRTMLPALILGAVIAMAGLVPAILLTVGADRATINEANQIYVFDRLSHHLVFHRFAAARFAWFGTLLAAWGWIAWRLRGNGRWSQLNRFTIGTLMIAAAGIAIDFALISHPAIAARLLKFYWYRLADIAVPMSVALAVPLVVMHWQARRPRSGRVGWSVAIGVPTLVLVVLFAGHQLDFRPRACAPAQFVTFSAARRAAARHRAWRELCGWIAENTSPEARFLTPRNQQTFKWYAGRAEIVCWKDIPQDPDGIVAWWNRLCEIYPTKVHWAGLGAWSDQRIGEFAERYQIDYVLVDRGRTQRRLGFQRVYPVLPNRAPHFELYRVYRPTGGGSGGGRE